MRVLLCAAACMVLAGCEPAEQIDDRATTNLARTEIASWDGTRLSVVHWPAAHMVRGAATTILILHDSGPMVAAMYRPWAEKLRDRGYAVVAFDKRGAGESGGRTVPASDPDGIGVMSKDALAVIRWLRSTGWAGCVGLLGFSQGGWVAAETLQHTRHARFAVLVSAPAVSTGEEKRYSVLSGDDSLWYAMRGLSLEEIERRVRRTAPTGYDPRGALGAIERPILWLYGGADRSIPVRISIEVIEEMPGYAAGLFEYRVFEHADHGLRIDGQRVPAYWDALLGGIERGSALGCSDSG